MSFSVPDGEDSLVIGHVTDDTGHFDKPGQFAGPLAAVSGDDLISAALTAPHQRRLIDIGSFDRLHQPLHFCIVSDAKGVIFERVQLEKIEITSSFTPRVAFRGADGCSVTAGASVLAGEPFPVGGLLWDILSRGRGLALSGAALPALGGRSLRGLTASFALSACLSLSGAADFSVGLPFVVPSRAAVKSISFPAGMGSLMLGSVICFSSLPGCGVPPLVGAEASFSLGASPTAPPQGRKLSFPRWAFPPQGALLPWTHSLPREPPSWPCQANTALGDQLLQAQSLPA